MNSPVDQQSCGTDSDSISRNVAGPVGQRSKKENKFSSTQAYSSLQNPSSKPAASSGKVLVAAKDLITPRSERVNVQA